MESVYLFGFFQSLFFILVLLTKKNKLISDFILSLFLLLLGGNLLFVYAALNNLLIDYPILISIDIFYWVLLGPTLVIYTNAAISGKNVFSYKTIYLFVPTFLIIIGFFEYIFIHPETFFSNNKSTSLFTKICEFVWLYNTPVYFLINIRILKKHSQTYKQYFSYSKNVDLKWLYFLTSGFAVFLIFMHLNPVISKFFSLNLPSSFSYTWFVMVIYISAIGFYGYKQSGVFSNFPGVVDTPIITSASESMVSYQKSGLIETEAKEILNNLKNLMEVDKIYLNSELDLSYLSEIINTSTHKLSQVINEKIGKNFFDYINSYRIEEVKKQLLDPEKNNFTILAIAYECGFNSKSAFYNMFKKTFDMTPSEYRKQKIKEKISSER